MTILGGDYIPIEVRGLDLVGFTVNYSGEDVFVLIQWIEEQGRKLPKRSIPQMPVCLKAKVHNNQVVNFTGEVATLHDIDGVWHYKFRKEGSQLQLLEPHTFFEIGDMK